MRSSVIVLYKRSQVYVSIVVLFLDGAVLCRFLSFSLLVPF